eukprot:4859342-Prymnesium_polylepis.1
MRSTARWPHNTRGDLATPAGCAAQPTTTNSLAGFWSMVGRKHPEGNHVAGCGTWELLPAAPEPLVAPT